MNDLIRVPAKALRAGGLLCLVACFLAGAAPAPLPGVDEIVFANRASYEDGHWYASIGYYCDDEKQPAYAGNGKPDTGKLCKLDLRTGKVTVLADAGGGSVRDPAVHYDGTKILFSMRKGGSPYYHLYEIGTDGSGLRQVTGGDYDDYEPTYLPDDDILFVSTRGRRWVNCWKTQVGILYRCGPNGERMRRVSANGEHDNTPAVLPDGRILYTRWEYTDRSQVGYHHLWTMNPDGTGQTVFYGNERHYPLYIAAVAVPGSRLVAGIDSPGHGRRDHYGHVTLFDPRFGPDDPRGLRRITRGGNFCDPYPLDATRFLAAQGRSIVCVTADGNAQVLHRSDANCYEPRPVLKRVREPVIAERTASGESTGTLVLADVTRGRNMEGVLPGEIRKLLVLEVLPKPVNFSGGPDLLSWLGTFTLERVLGTVPVEPDGSAHFRVPANRALFLVALDEGDQSVKRMQSFLSVMPGETLACIGCHETRQQAPQHAPGPNASAALAREPSEILPFAGYPEVADFNRDVQPVFDRNCLGCHSTEKHAGGLVLEGDAGPVWSLPYYRLLARLQVGDGRNGYGNQPPRTIGSSASPLFDKLGGGHHDVTVSPRDARMVWLWIESAAPYAGSYAALRNEEEMARDGAAGGVFRECRDVFARRCASCHGAGKAQPAIPFAPPPYPDTRGITRPVARHERLVVPNDPLARFGYHAVLNMSRPDRSPLLRAPLAAEAGGWGSCGKVFAGPEDPDYVRMLAALEKSSRAVARIPRYGTAEFRPNRQYVREMKKYGVLPESFDPLRDPVDIFETDRRYWHRVTVADAVSAEETAETRGASPVSHGIR